MQWRMELMKMVNSVGLEDLHRERKKTRTSHIGTEYSVNILFSLVINVCFSIIRVPGLQQLG